MQKRIIADDPSTAKTAASDWLDLETLAEVEVSSENPDYPIEAALLPGLSQGWQAGLPGKQTIRLLFKQPQNIKSLRLEFSETSACRTQEYALRLSQDNNASFHDIVRQRWNFSPDGSTAELETHCLDVSGVTAIELNINPDLNEQSVFATLKQLRIS